MITKLQRSVINKAKRTLKKYPWYKGVCLDKLPKDAGIKKMGVRAAVADVVFDTWYWDHNA